LIQEKETTNNASDCKNILTSCISQ
jgi:hypothetical protein